MDNHNSFQPVEQYSLSTTGTNPIQIQMSLVTSYNNRTTGFNGYSVVNIARVKCNSFVENLK